MSRITKQVVLEALYRLKENSNNKIWGLLSLFIATGNQKTIEGNTTLIAESDSVAAVLQDLFYFNSELKEFETNNQLFYRLSKNWESIILGYVPENKPKIIDAAIFYFKNIDFQEPVNNTILVSNFIDLLKVPKNVLERIFDFTFADGLIEVSEPYPLEEILADFKTKYAITNQNQTLSLDNPFTISSHPSEFKRAPFIQTLYSGSKIQELILLTDFNLDEFYPKSDTTEIQLSSNSVNKIFYGAPGTGKSFRVNEIIKGKEKRTERVIFHPEFDYSGFVGGFRPTMDGENIRYEFVPQAFTNIYVDAWNDLDQDYYLIIEEINRGNCSEIFGDIFQLLDRTANYQITPSKELHEHLKKRFDGNDKVNAEKLILPPNLNILATMNTSDQSLFPMDSAFKRRWDWEYIPINYDTSENNTSAKFRVKLSETEIFSWLEFIKSVNSLIKSNDNLGMDKCLGNYFIKPLDDIIDVETFVNKVIFYLWNDVFKDEAEEDSIFKNKMSYEDFFPVRSNGLESVKEILDILKVEYKSS